MSTEWSLKKDSVERVPNRLLRVVSLFCLLSLFQVIPRTWVHCLLLSAQKPAEWKRARTPTERHKCIAKTNYNPNPRGGSDAFIWKCSFWITGGPESPHVERGRGLKKAKSSGLTAVRNWKAICWEGKKLARIMKEHVNLILFCKSCLWRYAHCKETGGTLHTPTFSRKRDGKDTEMHWR